MNTTRIEFTPAQARALLHRLDLWDSFAEVFADTEGYEHLAPRAADRAQELAWQLQTFGYVDARRDELDDGLDREILREAVEGSTWPAVHDPRGDTAVTQQMYNGAVRALWNAWERIANAYGLDPQDIDFPQA